MPNKSLNQIKFIASIFVVLLHTSMFRYVNQTGFVFDYIVDTIARFGVPIFFSISGYFLYSKYRDGGKKYWLNYVKKILWLHLWVGFIYQVAVLTEIKLKGGIVPPSFFNPMHIVNSFLYGGLHTHLWYLSSLAFAVTVLFIASRFKLEKPLFYIGLILNIIGTFGNTEIYAPISYNTQMFFFKFFNHFGLHLSPTGFPSRNGLFFALPYIMMGYFIAQTKLHEKINLNKNKLFGLISLFILLQITERSAAVLLLKSSQGSNFFISTLPLVFFIMILGLKETDLFPKLNSISGKSLNIYLWHPMGMIIFTNILKTFTNEKEILFSLLFTPLIIGSILFFPSFKKLKLAK